jgi:hypothetical protein
VIACPIAFILAVTIARSSASFAISAVAHPMVIGLRTVIGRQNSNSRLG